MRRAAGRLPVHLLFDIDGTLLFPCRGHRWDDTELLLEDVADSDGGRARNSGLAARHGPCARRLAPLSCDKPYIQKVLLRPYVIPFLTHLLVDRVLDTDRAEVHVSLYTRQSASYCNAVADQVLLPALSPHRSGSAPPAVSQLFHRRCHSQHCVRVEEGSQGGGGGGVAPPPPPPPPSPSSSVCVPPVELFNWQKTISLSPSPLSTVLVDDSSYNFRPRELTAGHAILVPSFHPRADDFAVDECLSPCAHDAGGVVDAADGRGSAGLTATGVETRLLCLLERFVQACHDHRSVIEEMQRGLRWTEFYDADADDAHQRVLLSRMEAHCPALSRFNLFQRSPQYSQAWDAFHAPRENHLYSFFSQI